MAASPTSSLPASLARWGGRLLVVVRRWAEPPLAFIRRARDLAALVAMALLGFGISVYLTTVHYAKVPLVCSNTGVINCAAVTSSRYSTIPGTQLPITVPGMLWFVVSGALAVVAWVALERGQPEPERLRLTHLVWGGLGLAFVLYLVYAEIVQLHQICEWCTVVHLLTLLTFLIALSRLQRAQTEEHAAPVPSRLPASRRPRAASQATALATRVANPNGARSGSNGSNGSRGASRGVNTGTGAVRGSRPPARRSAPRRRP